jgi:hypothetical protein
MGVLFKPSIFLLDQSSKITNPIDDQDVVVRDDQTRQLMLPSTQKKFSYEVDFLGLEKFCLDSEILREYIFAKIGFKIFGTIYLIHILVTMLYSKYLFIWSGRVQWITRERVFLEVEGIDMGKFLQYY